MATRSQLLRPAATAGAPSNPVGPLDLWTRSDASRLSVSGARDFNGVDQKFDLGSNPPFGSNGISLAAFVLRNPGAPTGYPVFFGGAGTEAGISFRIDSTGIAYVHFSDGTASVQLTGPSLSEGSWVALGTTVENSLLKLFVNGVFFDEVDVSDLSASPEFCASNNIGAIYSGSYFNGSMARIAFANAAFTPYNFEELYNLGHGKTYAELSGDLRAKVTSYWNCLEAQGTLFDAADTFNDGTEVNGPIGSAPGPSVAVAADVSGNGHRGTLINMSDDVWDRDTPDGTYAATKEESVADNGALMLNFTDVDLAHVDGPNGSWGPFIKDQGSGDNGGWLFGGVSGSRSTEVPDVLGVSASLDLDGASRICIVENLHNSVNNLTVEGWINPRSANGIIAAKYSAEAGYRGWRMQISISGKLQVYLGEVGVAKVAKNYQSVDDVSLNEFHHVAFTFRAETLLLYVDGVLQDTTKSTDDPCPELQDSDLAMGIGNSIDLGGGITVTAWFDGLIADVNVHNATLSAADIQQLALGNAVGAPLGKWEFDQPIDLPYLTENKAIQFDGTADQRLNVDSAIVQSYPLTLSAWVNSPLTGQTVLTALSLVEDGSATVYVYIGLRLDGRVRCVVNDNGTQSIAVTPIGSVAPNTYHHIAAVVSAAEIIVLVDGVELDRAPNVHAFPATSNNVRIGQDGFAYVFTGAVADPRFYDAALTEDQIRDIISGKDHRTNLVSEWAFNDKPRSVPSTAGGYSLKFDGANQHVSADADEGDNTLSISVWINTSSTPAVSEYVIGRYDSDSKRKWGLRVSNVGDIGLLLSADGVAVVFGAVAVGGLRTGAWTHYVAVLDAANLVSHIYIDGKLAASEGTSITLFDSLAPVTIGSALSAGSPASGFNGNIDDVRIYPTALTAIDVQALYAGGDPIGGTPAAHWPFDDGPQSGTPNDGDIITSLTTREGRNLIFRGVSAAQRPQWFAAVAVLNNRPSLLYDGLDDCLEHLAKGLLGTGGQGVFQFVVHLLDQGVTQPRKQSVFSEGDPGTSFMGTAADNSATVVMNADSIESNVVLPKDQTHVVSIICDGTTYVIRVLTVQQSGGTGTWWDAVSALRSILGATASAGANSDFLSGYGPENLGYDRLLTNQEIAANEQYLLNRYGAY